MELSGPVPTTTVGHTAMVSHPDGDNLLFAPRPTGPSSAVSEFWLFTGAEWLPLPVPPLSARFGAATAFDRARNEFVLFGGEGPGGGAALAETWVFDGTTWTQRTPAFSPSARSFAAMAYDARRERIVLFGGHSGATGFNDTHEWDGTNWSPVSIATPPPVAGSGVVRMVYDAARQECGLLLNPGVGAVQFFLYSGRDWQSAPAPLLVTGTSLAYDEVRARVLAHGSVAVGTETWEWDGRQWFQRASGSLPSAASVFGYDARRKSVVAYGTSGSGPEMFAWMPEPQPAATPFGSPCADQQRVMRTAPGSAPMLGRLLRLEVDRAGSTDVIIGILGVSRTLSGGTPLPTPLPPGNPLNCQLRVDPFHFVLLAPIQPAPWNMPVPNAANLLGVTVQMQSLFLGPNSFTDATNGLELLVGPPPADTAVVEDFTTSLGRDALASGDLWVGGAAQSVGLGGSGRHGSFDPAVGIALGGGWFEFSTDNQPIPGTHTLSGQTETITDGRFEFTDFVVPAGTTVRFRGSNPVVLRVRGAVQIDGVLQANGEAQSTFNCRNAPPSNLTQVSIPGQQGSAGGPGGGRGGQGGDRCFGIGALPEHDGRPGQDVRLRAGHAYQGQSVGTGGSGSPIWPAHGLDSAMLPLPGSYVLNSIFNGNVNAGGGGGGFFTAGNPGVANQVTGVNSIRPGATLGGLAFNLLPLPPATASLEHFLVGGSGGGGGGSHPYLGLPNNIAQFINDRWKAGAGGTGGGGAVVIRAGSDIALGFLGRIEAKGGAGAIINADNPLTPAFPDAATSNGSWGIPAPGGGGSGGSLLLQSARTLVAHGGLDTSGGAGSLTSGMLPTTPPTSNITCDSRGGDGAPGFVRLEANGSITVTGTSVPAASTATLLDRDRLSGSRSRWVAPGTFELPTYLRYELRLDVGGQVVTLSDDPAVGPPADGIGTPVRLRFQAARLQPNAQIDPASIGPWREHAGSLQPQFGIGHDRGDVFRFDLVLDTSLGVNPRVLELAVFYR